jgi:hypothetical protein
VGASLAWRSARAEPGEQSACKYARLPAERRVGRDRHVGEQRDGVVGVVAQELGDRLLLDPPDLGRDGGELRMGIGELTPAERPAGRVGDRGARLGGTQRLGAALRGPSPCVALTIGRPRGLG